MSDTKHGELPRIIWMYWEQGLDNAPQLVRQCFQSWQRLNPDWKLIMLDGCSVGSYVDLKSLIGPNYDRLPVQHRSDILRLNLLAGHGGVWADATCLCTRPLDTWIHEYMAAGFFAFRDPGRDRLISNWFLASLPENRLTRSFCEANNAYWRNNRFPDMKSARSMALVRMFRAAIGKDEKRQAYWFSFLARRVLKIYPYFVFHYYFARHLRRDRRSMEIFESMPYFPAGKALSFQRWALGKKSTMAEDKDTVKTAPVLKLTWKKQLNFSDTVMRKYVEK